MPYSPPMDVPIACVGAALVLTYLPRIVVARGQAKLGYDNRNPRDQQSKLEGVSRRANAAHLNSFEAFAPFAAAVLACEVRGADATWTTRLAIAFVVARVLYLVAYLGNQATLRSTIWTIGVACVGVLFWMSIVR